MIATSLRYFAAWSIALIVSTLGAEALAKPVVAVLLPLTGGGMVNLAEGWQEDILKAFNEDVELEVFDTMSDPSVAVMKYKQAVEKDKAFMVIGPIFINDVMAIIDVATVPTIVLASAPNTQIEETWKKNDLVVGF